MALPLVATAGRMVAGSALRSLAGGVGAPTIQIELDTNATEIQRWMRAVFLDQLPYAMARAVNATAFDARDAIRRGIDERFTIRRPYVPRGVQIPPGGRATKQKPEAIVELDRRRSFLAKFEEGGVKRGSATMPIAIPTEHIRPVHTAIPPLSLYPKNLGLQERRDISGGFTAARTTFTRRGVKQWKGKRRTFVIDPWEHNATPELWGVWQRRGPKRHQIRLIWAYRREIPIPPTLKFVETGRRTVNEVWDRNFTREFDRAIRTAR